MKVLIAFFAALAVAHGALFGLFGYEPAIRAKFSLTNPMDSYYDIPTTCKEAEDAKWTVEDRPDNSYLPTLKLYCYKDKMFCVLFDDTCYFAGAQYCFRKDKFSNCYLFDDETIMAQRGYKNWTAKVDDTAYEFYCISYYTVDQDALDTSADVRISTRNPNRIIQNGYIILEGTDGLRKVSTNQADIEKEGIFTLQAKIFCMGTHYYYKMSKSTECTSDNIYPWFPLTHDGELVALGFLTFGELTLDDGERDWHEHPGETEVRMIVPNGPECLYDLVKKCNLFTMHTYFIAHPCSVII